MPFFSIIIPVYNVELYLVECLDSVLNQSFSDWEAVLVNDGSTDSSLQIAQKYLAQDSRFKLVSQENQGLSVARNTGIRNANGNYLVLLDSDDTLSLDGLEQLHAAIEKYNFPEVVRVNYESYDNISKTTFPEGKFGIIPIEHQNQLVSGFEYWNFNFQIAVMAYLSVCKKDFILQNNLFFEKGLIHEDEEWTPILYFYAQKLVQIPNRIYKYRIRPESITTTVAQHTKNVVLLKIIGIHGEKLKAIPIPNSIKETYLIILWDKLFLTYLYSRSGVDPKLFKMVSRKLLIPKRIKYQIYASLFRLHPSLYQFFVKLNGKFH